MIIDFHTHTFPDKIAGRALTKLSHNSHSKPFTDGTDTGLVRSMKESGIDLSVILPVATDPAQVMGINDSAARREEERLAEGLISFGAMHPDYEDWHGELARIRENGMKGIKIHPVYQGADLDDIRLLRIYDRCAELGLSVVIHAGFDIGFPGVDRCSPERSLHALRELRYGRMEAVGSGAPTRTGTHSGRPCDAGHGLFRPGLCAAPGRLLERRGDSHAGHRRFHATY